MKRKRYSPEQIVKKLRKADRLLADGSSVAEAIVAIEVSQPTYHRWRKEYGSMNQSEARKMKELQKENTRLKKLVAEQALDNAMLKEIAEGNW